MCIDIMKLIIMGMKIVKYEKNRESYYLLQ